MTTFPFTALTAAARQEGLIVAVLIGIAFGFVLERAGFGRADKLAAQFYFRDLRVFKVMFTAIVTAMLGLVIASGFGLTNLRDISESIASFTWIAPMVVGGFVLGAGFIISGYCPGTSIVAMGSGNIDGLFTVGGVVTGTFLYTQLLKIPAFNAFHNSTAKGSWFLYDLVKVPPALIAAAVALMAIAAFVGAEKIGLRANLIGRRVAFATVAALAVTAILTSTIAVPAVATPVAPAISADELAHAIVDAPWSLRILDLRDAAAFAKERVPGSQNVTESDLANVTDDGRAIVIVGDGKRLLPKARLLAGGFAAWKADPFVKAMTSGAPPPPPPAPAAGGVIAKPHKKGGGCSS
ncbi:MAG TPA: YeeE/YedE thiosulfate transporter family protein [Thermoanaerobaculia bacterium]